MERDVMRRGLNALFLLGATLLSLPALALTVGDEAPAFKLPTFRDAAPVSPSDYRGQVLYVDFWASWCGPCLQAFPLMEQLRTELKAQGFEVIAVNVDSDVADARKFLKKQSVTFPIVGPAADSVPTSYGVTGMPYGVVIDRQGRVHSMHAGLRTATLPALKRELQDLLAEPIKEKTSTPAPANGLGKPELFLFINQFNN